MSDRLQQSVDAVRRRCTGEFDLAVILGSGLGGVVAEPLEAVIPYGELPFFPQRQVPGHRGRLSVARRGDRRVLFFQGRFHLYQGLSAREVAAPVVLAHALGCANLLLTNASGGIREDLQPGAFLLIEDHIDLTGDNPLRGETDRPFLDLGSLYRQDCYASLAAAAAADGWELQRGVLCGMTGPSYETPAEVRALRALGADAVSMSTVHEAIMAHYLGLSVCALALIANRAAGLAAAPLSHAEVLAAGDAAVPRLQRLLDHLLRDFCD